MRRATRATAGALVALAILASTSLLGGCSTARTIPVEMKPASGGPRKVVNADLVGAYVSLTLRSGETYSGQVSDVSGVVVTLDHSRNGSYSRREVAVDEIAKIKFIDQSSSRHPHLTAVGVVASALFVLFVAAVVQFLGE